MIEKETLFSNVETVNSKQIAILEKHFPQCFDKDGRFVQDKLTEIIQGQGVDVTTESYSLDWLGKSYARLLANLPPETLITGDIEHNQEEKNKNSENLFIEGDNIEVLKHMVNAYSEKVKMIYIDPPYNTGSDGFVYQDDRKFTPEQLSELAGIGLDEAERILTFTDRGSNSHSAWLTFMYPRLYIARELLSDDGVIFISIDDNEVSQLRLICDEIFGERNFVSQFSWRSRTAKADVPYGVSKDIEWVIAYAKPNFIAGRLGERKYYKSDDFEDRWRLQDLTTNKSSEERPNSYFTMVNPATGKKYPASKTRTWAVTKDTVQGYLDKEKIVFPDSYDFLNIKKPAFRVFEAEDKAKAKEKYGVDFIRMSISTYLPEAEVNRTEHGSKEIREIFGGQFFLYPKPIKLITFFVQSLCDPDALILDFFSGSATTAHAVMQLNAEDGGNRKFIMVQIPEPIAENKPAYKAGYRVVSEISKERIHRAAKKIQEERPEFKGDLGFKLFKTIPDFRADADAELSLNNKTFFDDVVLSDEQYLALLTTWRVYDGSLLTAPVVDVSLGEYQAHLCDSRLYFIAPNFHSEALTTLLKQLDEDDNFAPNKIVLYGSNFDSSKQLEINDALKSYANKKSIELDLIVRY